VNLKGSKTEKNLKDAFAGESQANRRYYCTSAAKADVEGYNDRVRGVPFHCRGVRRANAPRTSGIPGWRWATPPRDCRSAPPRRI